MSSLSLIVVIVLGNKEFHKTNLESSSRDSISFLADQRSLFGNVLIFHDSSCDGGRQNKINYYTVSITDVFNKWNACLHNCLINMCRAAIIRSYAIIITLGWIYHLVINW